MKGTPLVVLDACVLAKFSLCDTLLPLGNRRGSLTEMVGGDPSGDNPHVGIGSRVAGLFDLLISNGSCAPTSATHGSPATSP